MSQRTSISKENDSKSSEKQTLWSKTGAQSFSLPHDALLQLQRQLGNAAVQKMYGSGALQAKRKIGEPNDVYEQEADRVAEQVMRMPEESAVSFQRSAIGKAKEPAIQLKPG